MTGEEARQKLDEVLAAFGNEVGMEGLATDENGVCLLVFDGRTTIHMLGDPSSQSLVVWSNLGALPSESADRVLRSLMQANLFWNGTGGATLGLMPEDDQVVLSIRRPLEGLGAAALRDVIELMVEQAEALAPAVAGHQATAAEPEHVPSQLQAFIRG
jgi:hypothetical protein